MKAAAAGDSKLRKPTASAHRRRPRCRDCLFCAPSGKCLDHTIRSGRCGDWVYYVLPGNKQWRRLWVKPRDPRTPKQRYWRARLGAASRNYSASLSDEQQDACIAAGAKRRSRPRLGQRGWLTGQQYWVGGQCVANAQAKAQDAEKGGKPLQTKGISTPTWDTHRSASVAPPGQHRRSMGRARPGRHKSEIRTSKPGTRPVRRSLKAPNPSGVKASVIASSLPRIRLGFRVSGFGFGTSVPGGAIRMGPGGSRPHGCGAKWRCQRAVVSPERGPPGRDAVLRETIHSQGVALPCE
jgi:hypothetical protein